MQKKQKQLSNYPVWFDGTNINEAAFCEEFLHTHKILFANNAFFTPEGRITDDLPLRGEIFESLKQTSYVKSIVTAQGKMDLERKGKQSYQGWLFSRLLAFSNGDLQALYDRSDGFYRRQLVLTAKEKPADRVDDPYLAEKMKKEAESIFLWAFEGLQRLVRQNFKFTESPRIKANRENVKRDNNNVLEFLESEGYIRFQAEASASSKELHESYRLWCEENSMTALKNRSFSDAMIAVQAKYNLEHCNTIKNSAGRRVWGLRSKGYYKAVLYRWFYGRFPVYVRTERMDNTVRMYVVIQCKLHIIYFSGWLSEVA